jgi:hypothetical protein
VLLSRRWRPVVAAFVCQGVLLTAGLAFAPGPLRDYPYLDNPLGLEAGGLLFGAATVLGWLLLAVLAGPTIVAVVLRLRRTTGAVHQQMKWIAAALVAVAVPVVGWSVLFPLGVRNEVLEMTSYLAPVMIPVAAGVSILRYRLCDVDHIISRTVGYTIVTGLMAAVYVLTVLGLSSVMQLMAGRPDDTLVTAGSTLAVAGAFRPVRGRVQLAVDERFNRTHWDAQRTVEEFAHRLRAEVDLDGLVDGLRSTTSEALQPTVSTVWLRPVQLDGPRVRAR